MNSSLYNPTASSKAFTVFINGDENFTGRRLVLNPTVIKTWRQFLNWLTESLNPRFGPVKRVYNLTNGKEITSFSYIYSREKYVVSDYRPLVRLKDGYRTEEDRKYQPRSGGPYKPKELVQRTFQQKWNFQWAEKHNRTIIYVHANGRPKERPRKFVLTPEDLTYWDFALSYIGSRLDILGVKKLYTTTGAEIKGPWEIQHGGRYVAVAYGDHFQPCNYSMYYKRDFSGYSGSWYKKDDEMQQLLRTSTPERPYRVKQKGKSELQRSLENVYKILNSRGERLRKREEPKFFSVKSKSAQVPLHGKRLSTQSNVSAKSENDIHLDKEDYSQTDDFEVSDSDSIENLNSDALMSSDTQKEFNTNQQLEAETLSINKDKEDKALLRDNTEGDLSQKLSALLNGDNSRRSQISNKTTVGSQVNSERASGDDSETSRTVHDGLSHPSGSSEVASQFTLTEALQQDGSAADCKDSCVTNKCPSHCIKNCECMFCNTSISFLDRQRTFDGMNKEIMERYNNEQEKQDKNKKKKSIVSIVEQESDDVVMRKWSAIKHEESVVKEQTRIKRFRNIERDSFIDEEEKTEKTSKITTKPKSQKKKTSLFKCFRKAK